MLPDDAGMDDFDTPIWICTILLQLFSVNTERRREAACQETNRVPGFHSSISE
jgi:hypothetical protein